MLDYKGIEALYIVQSLQSFEAAAQKLHITQSAISQRIKGLETYYGKPVLTRTLPYCPTELGKQLIGHFKQICLLEGDLQQQINKTVVQPHLAIAVNRDSLETWCLDLIEEVGVCKEVLLEIIADDQELTLDYLKNGLVSACLSTSAKEILGGRVQFLGNMKYILVASPSFARTFFSKGSPKECLNHAPAIKFDQNDKLHERYLEKFFNIDGRGLNYHIIPSVAGFKKCALLGYGYALIPTIDITQELREQQLVQLYSDKIWEIPLYWHYWSVDSKLYQKFNADVIQYARNKLQKQ